MGIDDDTATRRLAELHAYFREHPVTGPEGHSYVSAGPRATRTSPSLPFNAAVSDHIQACIQEVAEHTRAINPAAEPLPPRVVGAYDWCRRNTQNADEAQQQRRETVIYRQALEHAIRAGDDTVIPPHRCPSCRTWGLMWVAQMERAVCTNRKCFDKDGLSSSFTLAALAYEHVAARSNLRAASAT